MNSLQEPTRSRPVREFRTSGVICVGSLFNFSIVRTLPLFLERRPEVQRVASLSSTAAGLLRVSSSLRAELSTSRNHSVGKVSAFADESSDRSHPLTVCQRYCGRRLSLSAPSTSAMSVRERLVHPRFKGLSAIEARLDTPYGQDRYGLHHAYAPLRPRQTCRENGKASP